MAARGREKKILKVSSNLPIGMERPKWNLEDFSIVNQVYYTDNIEVCTAMCRFSNRSVAIKTFRDRTPDHEEYISLIKREISIHADLDHPNIVSFYAAFTDLTNIYIVMSHECNHDLHTYMKFNRITRFPEVTARTLILPQVLQALQYLHVRGICHRDIKPENILINDAFCIQLCDFGLAIDINREPAVSQCGTERYMAPEVIRCPQKSYAHENKHNSEYFYNTKADIWSIGILTYRLLTGIEPFIDPATPIIQFPKTVSREACDFIMACLHRDPELRPTCRQLLQSLWLRSPHTSLSSHK